MKPNKLSILITSWNTKDTVIAKLRMIVQELDHLMDYEVLVFDQGSTDDTVNASDNFLISCANLRGKFNFIFSGKNVGQSISRNRMMEQSDGEFVLFLDGDIVPIPNSIPCMVDYLVSRPGLEGLYYDVYSDTGKPENATVVENPLTPADMNQVPYILFHYAMYRREFIEKHPLPAFPPFDKGGWGVEEDVAMLLNPSSSVLVIKDRKFFHSPTLRSHNFLGDALPRSRAERWFVWAFLKQKPQAFVSHCFWSKEYPMFHINVDKARLSTPSIVSEAAYRALSLYSPIRLSDQYEITERRHLVFEHDLELVKEAAQKHGAPVGGYLTVGTLQSPIWLLANEPAIDYNPYGITLEAEGDMRGPSYESYRNGLKSFGHVETHDPHLHLLHALIGMPSTLLDIDGPKSALLNDFGLPPVVGLDQIKAFRALHQKACLNRVIFPLTKILCS